MRRWLVAGASYLESVQGGGWEELDGPYSKKLHKLLIRHGPHLPFREAPPQPPNPQEKQSTHNHEDDDRDPPSRGGVYVQQFGQVLAQSYHGQKWARVDFPRSSVALPPGLSDKPEHFRQRNIMPLCCGCESSAAATTVPPPGPAHCWAFDCRRGNNAALTKVMIPVKVASFRLA